LSIERPLCSLTEIQLKFGSKIFWQNEALATPEHHPHHPRAPSFPRRGFFDGRTRLAFWLNILVAFFFFLLGVIHTLWLVVKKSA